MIPRHRTIRILFVMIMISGLIFTAMNRKDRFNSYSISTSEIYNELGQDAIEDVTLIPVKSSVNAPGELQSANNTLVECEIDRLVVSARGGYLVSGNSARILKIIPDGSIVKKGDLLCQIDSRQFEEMARLQKINLEQAQLMTRYTEMDLEVSKIGVEEYTHGTAKQTLESLKRQIAITESDAERAARRMDWTKKMAEKGFMSENAVRAMEFQVHKADVLLSRAQMALDTFQKFSFPKVQHSLEARVQSRKWVLTYYSQWVETQKKRLALLEDQIAKCRVVAPHDGMVIYANEDDGDTRIELGAEVRRKQDLFYLPDLNDMEIRAKLSQSIVNQVRPGMPVTVRVESLSGVTCQGVVTKIAQMPMPPTSSRSSAEVKNYICLVSIDNHDGNLRPGMNAEIEIHTDQDQNLLAITPESVQVEGDREFCLVLEDNGRIVKREIRVKNTNPNYLVVLNGLESGEKIIRRPRQYEDRFGLVDEIVALQQENVIQQTLLAGDHQNQPEFDLTNSDSGIQTTVSSDEKLAVTDSVEVIHSR